MIRFLSIFAILISFVLCFAPAGAQADAILDFAIQPPTGGSISYAGGAAPLTGKNITIVSVTGLGTPANDEVTLPITSGLLNFATGNLSGFDPQGWFFNGGGSLTITGAVPAIGIDNTSTPLVFNGIISSVDVYKLGTTYRVAIGAFVDDKNATLADFFGIPSGAVWTGNFNISFEALGTPPSGFTSRKVLSGDVVNHDTPVPEPSALLLVGCGVLGVLGFRNRIKAGENAK